MKVLAINGSPHMDEGNTAMILSPFLEGMKEAGAIVELFYVRKLKIGPCNGDMSCWFKNPGKCGQDDDMQMLLPKFKDADVIVWASPVYYAGITGPLKNLMDRQLPLHVMGEPGSKKQKAVLVGSSLYLRSLGAVHVRSALGSDEGYLRYARRRLRVCGRVVATHG
jgi:multimeric flavodoxin WrbA